MQLNLERSDLAPLVQEIVAAVLSRLQADLAALPDDRMAFNEPEAARLVSLKPHQLRDERLRRRIGSSVGPGRKPLYSRADLAAYLAARRIEAEG